MEFFETFLINGIYILFPLLLYIVYVAYKNNLDQKKQQFALEVALFASLILVMRHGSTYKEGCYVVFLNIPLLISYMKKKDWTALWISIVLICYLHVTLKFGYPLLIFEYSIYFFIYQLVKRKNWTFDRFLNLFTLAKATMLSFEVFFYYGNTEPFLINLNLTLASILIFYSGAILIYYLLQKAEDVIQLNKVMKELENEKQLRSSLFRITHEIKNPIAVCKGYLDMIDVRNQQKVEKYVPIIQREISRTLTLMDDFLDYTRIKIQQDILDIYFLLEDITDNLYPLFSAQKIDTDFEIPEEELFLLGDYDRLKQVFINVFKNAKEAEATKVILKTKRLKDQIKITVWDNGIGMDEETLKRVGEMFFTTKAKGSGLGTGLSKEIIELHGGILKYESKLGVGTKVSIYLPIQKEVNVF